MTSGVAPDTGHHASMGHGAGCAPTTTRLSQKVRPKTLSLPKCRLDRRNFREQLVAHDGPAKLCCRLGPVHTRRSAATHRTTRQNDSVDGAEAARMAPQQVRADASDHALISPVLYDLLALQGRDYVLGSGFWLSWRTRDPE